MSSFLRHHLGAFFFALVLIAAAATGVIYLVRSRDTLRPLYEAKFLSLRIEDIPLPVRAAVAVEVMTGVPSEIDCERVSPPVEVGKALFRFDFGGVTEESPTCKVHHVFSGVAGSSVPVNVDYVVVAPDGTQTKVDRFEGAVKLRDPGPYLELQTLQTPDKKELPSLTVPQLVVPYVDTALDLAALAPASAPTSEPASEPTSAPASAPTAPKPEELVALFFLQRPGQTDLFLRVAVPAEGGQKPHAIAAPLKEYRRFGDVLKGYAAWPTEPIAVGNPEDVRQMFEIVTAVFRTRDVEALLTRCCGGSDSAQGLFVVNGLPPEDVRALAVDGRLSTPIRVVRAAGTALTPSGVVLPQNSSAPQ